MVHHLFIVLTQEPKWTRLLPTVLDYDLQALTEHSNLSRHPLNDGECNSLNDVDDEEEEEYDTEAWETITMYFREVQSVLDKNRAVIQQVNKNHQSELQHNLVKNIALIRDMNSNMSVEFLRFHVDNSFDRF